MKRNFDIKITDIKREEEKRRAEITMMYIYMDRYPDKARAKLRKPSPKNGNNSHSILQNKSL